MKVAIISVGNPRSLKRWSGTSRHVISALEAMGNDVTIVDDRALMFLVRGLNVVSRKMGMKVDWRRASWFAHLGSFYCSVALIFRSFDVVMSLAAGPYTAYLKTNKPIITMTDATFSGLQELYRQFQDYPQWMIDSAKRIDRVCFNNSSIVVLPCKWAEKSAIHEYNVPSSKIIVAPFGANLPEDVLQRRPTVKFAPSRETINLLYISVDWERKGGDVVVDTVRTLNRRCINAKLFLVGNIPDRINSDEQLEVVGFLNKSDRPSLEKLIHLFKLAHFFILPTSGDCFPVVFSEAQAFGCPSITYDVGGTADAVLDGITGAVLPLGAPADAFADKIEEMISRPAAYQAMSVASRQQFETRSNWKSYVSAALQGLGEAEKRD